MTCSDLSKVSMTLRNSQKILLNQPQKAIEYLEKSLELGYDGYSMMLTDLYLDPIRDLPEYKTTVEKCKTKYLAQFEE